MPLYGTKGRYCENAILLYRNSVSPPLLLHYHHTLFLGLTNHLSVMTLSTSLVCSKTGDCKQHAAGTMKLYGSYHCWHYIKDHCKNISLRIQSKVVCSFFLLQGGRQWERNWRRKQKTMRRDNPGPCTDLWNPNTTSDTSWESSSSKSRHRVVVHWCMASDAQLSLETKQCQWANEMQRNPQWHWSICIKGFLCGFQILFTAYPSIWS